jgi:predicted aspartyl protease
MLAIAEPKPMGRVLTDVMLENLTDLWEVKKGMRTDSEVRRELVKDALVDTGASTLSLPTSLIKKLGLEKVTRRRIRSATGTAEVDVYDAVRFTIQGRDGKLDVMEVPDDVPVLVGQLPLEMLDFVVDPSSRRLIGNPAHNGEWIMELY